VDTFGPEVADICRLAGFPPDPEQELALDAIFAIRPDGKSAAFEFGIVCPRQNMKTGLLKMAVLGWLFVTEQRLIVWSAHEMKTTKEAFRDLENLITGCPELKSRLAKTPTDGIYRGNGEESIELDTGQRVMFKARTHGGGRGLTGDKVILDEAMYLEASHMGSLLPTLTARPDPQVCYAASAGLQKSEVLRGIRDRGRSGEDPSLAYFEWAAERGCELEDCTHELDAKGCALDDRSRWAQSNPALGRRIQLETLESMRRALPPTEFAREFLSWWDDPVLFAAVFGEGKWLACRSTDSEIRGLVTFGLAVSLDRSRACIGASGFNAAGDLHVELVDHQRDSGTAVGRGTAWVPGRLQELQEEHGGDVVLDGLGPAHASLAAIQSLGVYVTIAATADVLDGCSQFYDRVQEKTLAHLPSPELDAAVSGAVKRPVGDRFAWGRKTASEIVSLEAVTLAAWGADKSNVPTAW
jgi:hypothetical protein